jgi:hypothetical protein
MKSRLSPFRSAQTGAPDSKHKAPVAKINLTNSQSQRSFNLNTSALGESSKSKQQIMKDYAEKLRSQTNLSVNKSVSPREQ